MSLYRRNQPNSFSGLRNRSCGKKIIWKKHGSPSVGDYNEGGPPPYVTLIDSDYIGGGGSPCVTPTDGDCYGGGGYP